MAGDEFGVGDGVTVAGTTEAENSSGTDSVMVRRVRVTSFLAALDVH